MTGDPMIWLFIIDPIEELNLETDSTFAIMKEAFRQGIEVYYCTIQDIFHKNGVICIAKSFFLTDKGYDIGQGKISHLDSFNIIFMRKDPPYDMKFHYVTELLSLAKSPVINSPQALRDFNEKLIILPFAEFIPETIVTASELQIKDFLKNHSDGFILKSLDSYQGRSVEWITKDDENSNKLIKAYTKDYSTPVMIQEYIPDVRIGDKRILVLGGKIIGAVLREPLKNNYLANLGQGGIARKTTISKRENEMVNSISDFLLKNGLHFVGFDFIGDYLTEINITCPTGIVHINQLNDVILEKQIVEYFRNLVRI